MFEISFGFTQISFAFTLGVTFSASLNIFSVWIGAYSRLNFLTFLYLLNNLDLGDLLVEVKAPIVSAASSGSSEPVSFLIAASA